MSWGPTDTLAAPHCMYPGPQQTFTFSWESCLSPTGNQEHTEVQALYPRAPQGALLLPPFLGRGALLTGLLPQPGREQERPRPPGRRQLSPWLSQSGLSPALLPAVSRQAQEARTPAEGPFPRDEPPPLLHPPASALGPKGAEAAGPVRRARSALLPHS